MKIADNQNIEKILKLAKKQINSLREEDRMKAINYLQIIVEKHPHEYERILNIIICFIKKNRSIKSLNDSETNPITEIGVDIQAALKIIINPDIDEYLRKDKIDLSDIDIRNANLYGANLQKANLQQSILYRANLIEANLENANLSHAVLSAVNFCGANLARTKLCGAILNAANLSGANLTCADLRGANLFLANLQGANLDGANLDGANLREADFCGNKANRDAHN